MSALRIEKSSFKLAVPYYNDDFWNLQFSKILILKFKPSHHFDDPGENYLTAKVIYKAVLQPLKD